MEPVQGEHRQTDMQQGHQQLDETLAFLDNIANGQEIIIKDTAKYGSYFGCFKPNLNPEQSKVFLEATIDCINRIRAREPNSTDSLNLNDLPLAVHGSLCQYVQGTIKAASTKEDVDFNELRCTIARWRETIETLTKEINNFYPALVIGKTKLLDLLVSDCEKADGPPKDNFGKNKSPSYQAFIQTQLNEMIPTFKAITKSEAVAMQLQGSKLGEDPFDQMVRKVANNEIKGADHYLVSWKSTDSTARGVVINGKFVTKMQHGRICSFDRSTGESLNLGYYSHIENGSGKDGREHKVIIMLPPNSEIEVNESVAQEGYCAPTWY